MAELIRCDKGEVKKIFMNVNDLMEETSKELLRYGEILSDETNSFNNERCYLIKYDNQRYELIKKYSIVKSIYKI